MSQAREQRRKERRRNQTREVKMLRNNIRRGIMPTFHLAKQKGSGDKLEREYDPSKPYRGHKLTWRQVGTFKVLMELPEVKKDVNEDQPQDPAAAPQSA